MQSLTRNPLADPYLLGLSSGASLGAVAVLVVGVGLLLPWRPSRERCWPSSHAPALAAPRGTLAPGRARCSPAGRLAAGRRRHQLRHLLDRHRRLLPEILNWLLGSLAGATLTSVAIAGVAVLAVGGVLVLSATRLDAFAFGDTSAAALGIDVDRTRWTLMTVVALLTGAMVAVSGAIGFVGLILPTPCRRSRDRPTGGCCRSRPVRRRVPGLGGHPRPHAVRPARSCGRDRHRAHRRPGVRVPAAPRKGSAWT